MKPTDPAHYQVLTGIGDKVIDWLVGFSVKLRLTYNDYPDLPNTTDELTVLKAAFPEWNTANLFGETKETRVIALRMVMLIRLFQQEIAETMANVVIRPGSGE